MKLKAVINLFGGPGCGKSTTAAALFAIMKKKGLNVEFVPEYAKHLLAEDRMNVLKEDQLYVLAKQHRKIFVLRDTVDYIVTDSPFLQGYQYMGEDSIYDRVMFKRFSLHLFKQYPNFNVFLVPGNTFDFEEVGRYQNEKEAKKIGRDIANFLTMNCIGFTLHVSGHDNEESIIRSILDEEGV